MKRLKSLLMSFLVIIAISGFTVNPVMAEETDYDLTMDVIDVGEGLSLLFESGGEYMLYDGGDREYSSKVVAYLKQEGIETLDYVIASHYDADHLNGIVGALNVFNVENVIAPDYTTDTRVYESFKEILPEKGIELTYPEPGQQFTFGNATVTVIAPNGSGYSDVNDYSVGIRIDSDDNSILVTGDATVLSEQEMIACDQNLDADILVVGHHGSDTSTCNEFLQVVSPQIAVISCGEDNQYLHPSQTVMELLQGNSIPVYRTDKQGDFNLSFYDNMIIRSVDPCNDYSYGEEKTIVEKNMYATTGVNIRSAASTDSDILGKLNAGDQISVTEISGDWAKILYNGAVAYVAVAYLSETEPVIQTEPVIVDTPSNSITYILNTNTHKFHYPSCHSVKQMKDKNKAESNESRDTIIAMGYDPCKNCNP